MPIFSVVSCHFERVIAAIQPKKLQKREEDAVFLLFGKNPKATNGICLFVCLIFPL